MNEETKIQNEIRMNVNDIAVTFRANVGKFYTEDGRQITTGLPKGFPDLFGYRKSDGRIIFMEVKTDTGKLRKDQKKFLKRVVLDGCIAGVVRNTAEARELILTGKGVLR